VRKKKEDVTWSADAYRKKGEKRRRVEKGKVGPAIINED